MNHINGIPRRIQLNELTPEELQIRQCMVSVENLGADVRLTDVICLLQAARDRLADFVDNVDGIRTLPIQTKSPW